MNIEDADLSLMKTKSNVKPSISDYFKQTSKVYNDDDLFDKANEEVDGDALINKKDDINDEDDDVDDEAEEDKSPDSKPIFQYKENIKPDIPLPRPKNARKSSEVKKLMQPPKQKSGYRHSEVKKFDYNDMLE